MARVRAGRHKVIGGSDVRGMLATWAPALEEQAGLVARASPAWSGDVHRCVELARRPPPGLGPLERLLDGFGADLEARYLGMLGSLILHRQSSSPEVD